MGKISPSNSPSPEELKNNSGDSRDSQLNFQNIFGYDKDKKSVNISIVDSEFEIGQLQNKVQRLNEKVKKMRALLVKNKVLTCMIIQDVKHSISKLLSDSLIMRGELDSLQ